MKTITAILLLTLLSSTFAYLRNGQQSLDSDDVLVDYNGDGKIDDLDKYLSKYDLDKDGKLSKEEKQAALSTLDRDNDGDFDLMDLDILKKIDKNGDFQISQEEINHFTHKHQLGKESKEEAAYNKKRSLAFQKFYSSLVGKQKHFVQCTMACGRHAQGKLQEADAQAYQSFTNCLGYAKGAEQDKDQGIISDSASQNCIEAIQNQDESLGQACLQECSAKIPKTATATTQVASCTKQCGLIFKPAEQKKSNSTSGGEKDGKSKKPQQKSKKSEEKVSKDDIKQFVGKLDQNRDGVIDNKEYVKAQREAYKQLIAGLPTQKRKYATCSIQCATNLPTPLGKVQESQFSEFNGCLGWVQSAENDKDLDFINDDANKDCLPGYTPTEKYSTQDGQICIAGCKNTIKDIDSVIEGYTNCQEQCTPLLDA